MEVYIIKYALTKGIFVADGETGPFDGFITVGNAMFNRNEWADSKYNALVRAEQMRQAEIQKSERKIEKLNKLDFTKILPYEKM